MNLDHATAEHYETLRQLDRIAARRQRAVAVTEAQTQRVVDYWCSMPRPYAVATSARPNSSSPGHYVVTVQCPYCGQQHSHGWGGPEDPGGHRTAHCSDPLARSVSDRGYVLVVPASVANSGSVDRSRPCPSCGAGSIYDAAEDRYFHADGTENRHCWIETLRGGTP